MEKKRQKSEAPKNVNLNQLLKKGSDFTFNAQSLRNFLSSNFKNILRSTFPPPRSSPPK